MTNEELQKALVAMVKREVVNSALIEALHKRGYIRDVTANPKAKRTWQITDEGKKFAGLDF